MPSRHFLPLPSKYEEITDRREERHLKTGHSSSPKARKSRYTDKFKPPYDCIESTLSTSPHFGNAGKPRPNRQRQLKVTRTKSHQCISNERWNHNSDKHLLSTKDDPKTIYKSKRKNRRSNAAILMRKCNRSQKRQEKRKLHRMVRKFSPVLALQECTYHRAQEGLTATNGHFHSDNTGTKIQKNLKIATLNCKGANHISAREKIAHMMKTHKLDILFLQETHINTNTEEHHDQYCFVFSSSITDQQREEASKAREMAKTVAGKGKNKGKNQFQLSSTLQSGRRKARSSSCLPQTSFKFKDRCCST